MQWIGTLCLLSRLISATEPSGNAPSERRKTASGAKCKGLLHGEAGIGAAIGIDQAEERPQLVFRLLVGRARIGPPGIGIDSLL